MKYFLLTSTSLGSRPLLALQKLAQKHKESLKDISILMKFLNPEKHLTLREELSDTADENREGSWPTTHITIACQRN